MRALVTGGGGFLGTRIAQLLHARGDAVVVLGRNRYPHHEQAGMQTIQADVCDGAALARACHGVDTVFHVAALAAIWGPRKTFWRINVLGTQNLLAACARQGVKRLIYTSTPSVVFGKEDLCGVDESQPYPTKYLTHYAHTKAIAEQLVLRANSPALATVALRPHLIWGPGDPHLLPRIIARAAKGRLVQVGDGRNKVDITYLDTAAYAHVRAADALDADVRCAGRPYFISQGQPVELWPWLSQLLDRLGLPPVRRVVSFKRAYRLGTMLELVYAVARISQEPAMTRFLALQLAKSHYFNVSASNVFMYFNDVVSIEVGIDRTVAWFRSGPPARP